MGRERYTAEQIIGMLREAEVLQSQSMTIGDICRKLGITEHEAERPPPPQVVQQELLMAAEESREYF